MLCFNQRFLHYLFAFGISGQGGSGLIPKSINETAEDKHNNDDEVDKQHSPRKPNTTCFCELVCLYVSLRQQWWFLFESCGFQPQTLSPSWSSRNGGSWLPRMLCFPQSLLTAVPPAMGPSAFSIKRHVCAPHLFVLTDDFCNKTQTFWYFLDSWVMTLCFAFLGLWLSPVENEPCRNY